ncbi:MAG TPA: SBBP repeat-containing protein [Ignavibacteria bacterium]|nr:SBBP repeat-containing protein [Ignavibacteria bacterium]
MKKLLILLFFIFYAMQTPSQWTSRYNGPGNSVDEAFAIAIDASGSVYVTGSSFGSGSNLDYATVKYSSAGQEQWAARYNGPANLIDIANAIAIDGAGNVYVTGTSTGSFTLSDYATIKYNSAGQMQWTVRYNGPANGIDEAVSVAVDGSGNVYVTGQSISSTNYDFATIKYNSTGQMQWEARYNGPQSSIDNGAVVRVDNTGNVYVTGGSTGSGSGYDYATIKYNSSGQVIWVSRYNGTNNADDIPSDLEIDVNGNVFVTGGSSGSTSSNDYLTIKYNSTGQVLWTARYNGVGNDNDVAFGLVVNSSGIVFVTGSSIGQGSATDYATVAYQPTGQQIWATRYNGPNNTNDDANAIAADGYGNVYVTGQSNAGGTNLDYLTLKYNSTGNQIWEQRYNGPGNGVDAAMSIAVDNGGNVHITGLSQGSGSSSDYASIKYVSTVGIEPVSNNIPDVFMLYPNFPNPFNPSTKIKFDLPVSSESEVTVYDVSGKVVSVLVDENLRAGTYEIEFDAKNLATGVYFFKIEAANFVDTKKMMLVK